MNGRFQREEETILRLSHPNIAMADDADENAVGHFLVMEYVNGADLASLVHKHGTFGVVESVNGILQVTRGSAYAHGQGIIPHAYRPPAPLSL